MNKLNNTSEEGPVWWEQNKAEEGGDIDEVAGHLRLGNCWLPSNFCPWENKSHCKF